MLKRQIQRSILLIALSVLFVMLTGKYLLSPIEPSLTINEHAIVLGIGFLSTVKIGITACESLMVRFQMMKKRHKDFPDSTVDVKAAGVKTPVDFSYMMLQFLFDVQPELFGGILTNPGIVLDPKLSKKGVELFREMFGRMPLPRKTIDWSVIAKAEVENQIKTNLPDFDIFSIYDYVSPEARKKIGYGRKDWFHTDKECG